MLSSHARVFTRRALRDDATRPTSDGIGSKSNVICVLTLSTLLHFVLLSNVLAFLSRDISHQGDIQGTYDAIDKESFTQTDRQVRSNKTGLCGPSLLQFFIVTTRPTKRIGRGGKTDSLHFASAAVPILLVVRVVSSRPALRILLSARVVSSPQ